MKQKGRVTYHPLDREPSRPASLARKDGYAGLAAAVIWQATRDARAGSNEAAKWLKGDEASLFLEALQMDSEAGRKWLNNHKFKQKEFTIMSDQQISDAIEEIESELGQLSEAQRAEYIRNFKISLSAAHQASLAAANKANPGSLQQAYKTELQKVAGNATAVGKLKAKYIRLGLDVW